ncbi:MAG: hypothetical protein HETSPECPRED_010412 [Heterodermia speciosa]|uniref:Uncharacterized protein n=1 Tax=Heterodermia speciosa TaxID=116794 RepID=A0A8H3G8B9_9LECA|nr:MAG: hypothetical protein HETSPECPRED_010412 [Heterodermia speciosa]
MLLAGFLLIVYVGTVAYQLNGLDECCGECRILYPNVQVYYWPVKKNSNTWCLQYNFTSSVTASTDTNFDNGKLVFGTLPSDNSVPTDHPTLTTPESDGLPTNLPTLPGVSRGSPNDFPTLSGIPIRPSHSSHSISSTDSHISVNPSKTKSTLSVSPTFGIPLPPRAILQSSITKSASLPGNSAKTLKARTFIPLNGTEVYALAPDGKNSFTSPTIYVVISTISARDSCGMLGNAYTSLTIPFDASELSTVDGITDKTAIFNFADLPCPPHEWVEDKTVPNPLMGNSAMRSDYAKDYHPRILVPHQTLKDIDPSWARSSCVIEDVGQGYDPPRQLVPVTALTADSTSSLDPRTSSAAQPQSQAQDPASRPTCKACLKPDFHTPVSPQIPNATPNDPSQPVEPDPATPNAVPIPSAVPVPSAVVIGGQTLANSGQPVHFISNTEVPNPQAIPLTVGPNIVPGSTQPVHTLPQSMPPANPITINGLTLTPTSIPPQDPQVVGESPANESPTVPGVVPGASPNVPASAASQNGPQPGNGSPEPVVIGGLTMTPQAAAPSQVPKQAQPGSMLVVAAGVTLTRVVSSASGFGGLSNGEPALINVGEQPLSFKPAPVFTIGGSTFIGNPSSIQVGNTVLSKGEPAITIANTPLSLGPAGLVVGSETIPAASLNGVQPSSGSIPAYVVGGQTLSVGGPGINVKGTSLSVASQGILVGGQTLSIPSATALPTVAGQQIRTQPNGNIIVHGITIQAGGPPATIDGSTLSMLPSGNAVVVNGQSTVSISRIPTVAGQQVRPAPSGLVIIGSQILTPGAQATISSTRVSVLHSGGIVVGGSTVAFTSFSTPASDQQPSIFSIDGTALTSGSAPITVHGTVLSLGSDGLHMGSSMMPYASISNLVNGASPSITAAPFSHGYLIGGQILQPGRAITISGTIVSLGSSSSELIVGGTRTFNLAPSASLASIFAVGGQVFTAAVNGFPIDGTSLYPGQATTIAHTRVSLNPIGLVIGTATYPLLSPSSGSIFALEGQSLTANPSGYSIGGGELTPGGEVTVSGTLISLAATGAIVIGGSRTVPLAAMTPGKAESVFTRSSGGYAVDGTEVPSSSVALVTVSGHITSELVTAVVVDSSTKVVNGGSSGIATTSSSSVGRAARKEVARGLLVTMGIILGGVVMSV